MFTSVTFQAFLCENLHKRSIRTFDDKVDLVFEYSKVEIEVERLEERKNDVMTHINKTGKTDNSTSNNSSTALFDAYTDLINQADRVEASYENLQELLLNMRTKLEQYFPTKYYPCLWRALLSEAVDNKRV